LLTSAVESAGFNKSLGWIKAEFNINC